MKARRNTRGLYRFLCGCLLLALGVLVTTAVVASTQRQYHYVWGGDAAYGNTALGIARGSVFYATYGTPLWTRGGQTVGVQRGIDWIDPFADGGPSRLFAGRVTDSNGYTLTRIVIWPLALLLSVTGVLLAWSGYTARRRSRIGCCVACGYDLRGLADGAACPECGEAVRNPQEKPR